MESEGDGKRRKKRKATAKIPLHSYTRTLGRSVPSKRRKNTPYRRHYKQLVLEHMGDIPSATLAHHRDLDAADTLIALSGGNLANKISDVADTVGTAAGLAGLASGATGIGAVATPFLEGLSGVANATSFVSGLFGDGQSDEELTLEPVEDEPEPEAQMASAEGTPHPGILRQMLNVVDKVGDYAGMSRGEMLTTLADLAESAVQTGLSLQDISGNPLSYEEWYLNASPQRLQEALQMITPRTPLWRRTGQSSQSQYADVEAEARNAPFGSGKTPHDKFMDATHAYCDQRGSGIYPDWVERGMKSLTGQGPFDERLSVPEVMAAQRNLRENPSAARMYRQRLVTPGQAADSRFVSSLEYTALNQAKRPRRYTKVPRYRGTRYAKK
eukprot:COSAG01_NODE_3999_length_5446_cov_4.154853_2_plen_385_part_00